MGGWRTFQEDAWWKSGGRVKVGKPNACVYFTLPSVCLLSFSFV